MCYHILDRAFFKENVDLENKNTPECVAPEQSKKGIKKKIIVLICAILALIALMFGAVLVLEKISNNLEQKNMDKEYEFDFYEVDYSEDIFSDPEYLELIENSAINFCNMDNVTIGITEEDASRYGEDVKFMVDYVHYMTYGEVEKYNSCYSDLYYTVEKPHERFTMQKIYNVELIKISQEAVTDENGKEYTEYVFTLGYQILENNGTLRNDFLNGSKKQYILLTNREGSIKIDGITTTQSKY